MISLRVLLIQADGKTPFPNLALMKLSAWHKRYGDEVGFNVSFPDRVYVSCIFTKNLDQAKGIHKYYQDAEIFIGGPALNEPNYLPNRELIDDIMPDYSLYGLDNKDGYSLGFTSRGCIRRCPSCFVPNLEGDIREGTPIENFHYPLHKKMILLDNNILASPTRDRTFKYILDHDLKVNVSQAFDARLVDKEAAQQLKEMKLYNWHFTRRKMHFAWDFMEAEREVLRGFNNLIESGITRSNISVYILVGYNTTLEEDLFRIHAISKMGFDPYVMVYNNLWDKPILQRMERWCNAMIIKKTNFTEYDRLSLLEKIEAEKAEKAALQRLSVSAFEILGRR